ncbi:MAG: hypothetical protein HY662_04410 [Chloroflexi bacterium]|nr:hypothetical protein [Chloroflexota bacterium]
MGDIKSALEIAMEKVAKLGETTEEERLKWKYVPAGEQLAAKCLREDCNLIAELKQYPENVKKYVIEGAVSILVRNIAIPKTDAAKINNKKAMDGLKTLKTDKVGVENIYSKMRYLFNHYSQEGEQQRKQAYQSLRASFEAQIQQAMKQQMGNNTTGMRINVEQQPQFQQEWHRVSTQLESQYLTLLSEYKQALLNIP